MNILRNLASLLPVNFRRIIRTKLISYNVKLLNSKIISFSQSGEDFNIRNIFKEKKNGFYVDVGAHHPFILSNTNYSYVFDNWCGINIDASSGCMKNFKKYRKRDINLEFAISSAKQELTFYVIDDTSTLNSFSREFLIENNLLDKVKRELKIQTHTLAEVLDEYLPLNQQIDLLNIDVEGMDIEILKSNNWNKYRPVCIIAESDAHNISDIFNSEITEYLHKLNYEPQAITYLSKIQKNTIYIDKFWKPD